MIFRTYEAKRIEPFLLPETVGFDPENWREGSSNVILTDGRNYSLFFQERPGVYAGHVFFEDRGREALKVGKEMLSFFFWNYPAEIVLGLTPEDCPQAIWFNKKLGFTSHGVLDTPTGKSRLFIMLKGEFLRG